MQGRLQRRKYGKRFAAALRGERLERAANSANVFWRRSRTEKMKGGRSMSKYDALWAWIRENGTDSFKLTYGEIEKIAGLPLDHSFLKYKKELTEYGYQVGKISLKEQTVAFHKID